MIIYGVSAEASIGGLFLGGVIPGLLMAGALMVMVRAIAIRRNLPRVPFPTLADVASAFKGAFWALMAPVVFGGMMSGIFTATESAAVAALYALVVGLFYADFRWRDIPRILLDTVETTACVDGPGDVGRAAGVRAGLVAPAAGVWRLVDVADRLASVVPVAGGCRYCWWWAASWKRYRPC